MKSLIYFVLTSAVISGIFLTIYGSVQQNMRMDANDPEMQMAEDAARYLETDWTPAAVMPIVRNVQIDVGQSLAPFIMVFDDQGTVLESSMKLGERIPVPPAGVLDKVRMYGEHAITTQPEPGVRIANVIVPIRGAHPGFVLAGRSLREVENRYKNIFAMCLFAWACAIFCAALGFAVHWKSTHLKDPHVHN